MKRPNERLPSNVPYNPGLGEFIEAKRQWSVPRESGDVAAGFRGWHERGYLPHRDAPGLIQFVTFRLADSFPESLRSEWEHVFRLENNALRRIELERYLDKGRGECLLSQLRIASLVDEAVRFFQGDRYDLLAWVVMPNHVHVLFQVDDTPMAEIVQSWKKQTAIKANRLLRRQGAFWQPDYWDTYMRDSAQTLETVHYIEQNPVAAGLLREAKSSAWSSARFRDEIGKLKLR